MKVQSLLPPCKGTNADFHVNIDKDYPELIQIWLGTALLANIPNDSKNTITRCFIGLLGHLKFSRSGIGQLFDISSRTVDRIVSALSSKYPVTSDFDCGRGMPPEIEQYARYQYQKSLDHNDGKHLHGIFEKIRQEIINIWDKSYSHEHIRKLLGALKPVKSEYKTPVPKISSDTESRTADNTMSVMDNQEIYLLEECGQKNVSESVLSPPATTGESNKMSYPEGESVSDQVLSATGSGISADQLPENNAVSDVAPIPDGASGNSDSSTGFVPCSGLTPEIPVFLSHAGHLIVSPWFEDVLAGSAPILRLTAAQILQGAVTQEDARETACSDFNILVGKSVKTPNHQRQLLDELTGSCAKDNLLRENIVNLELSGDEINVLYDPHPKKYTGREKMNYIWLACEKKTGPGILMDCVHTPAGEAILVENFDGFYDCRERFFMIKERLQAVLPEELKGRKINWVVDRGFSGIDFLRDTFYAGQRITIWEKDYQPGGWDLPFINEGKGSVKRLGNSTADEKQIEFQWREQKVSFESGIPVRRIIIRIEDKEMAILTTSETVTAELAAILMLNRWKQEGYFSRANRHLGFNQLTVRKVIPYADVIDEFNDREVESRNAKKLKREKKNLRAKLGNTLVKISGMPAVTLNMIRKEREKLYQKLDELKHELHDIPLVPEKENMERMEKVGKALKNLASRFRKNRKKVEKADVYEQNREIAAELKKQIKEITEQIKNTASKESKLLIMLEEQFAILDMERKNLVDAVRITAGNIFDKPLRILRKFYNNFRDDHENSQATYPGSGIRNKKKQHPTGYSETQTDQTTKRRKKNKKISGYLSGTIQNKVRYENRIPIILIRFRPDQNDRHNK